MHYHLAAHSCSEMVHGMLRKSRCRIDVKGECLKDLCT